MVPEEEASLEEDLDGDAMAEDEVSSCSDAGVSSTAVSPEPIPIPAPVRASVHIQRAVKGHGTKDCPYNLHFSRPSVDHMAFLQNLVKTAGFTEVFPSNFPHATRQALALPLAEPRMSQADITRHVYMLVAAGVEVMRIACLMNSWHATMLELLGGKLAAIPIVEVEPEDFDVDGNLSSKQ